MDILKAWTNTYPTLIDNTSVDSVRFPRPPESLTRDTMSMISTASANISTQMCVDHLECAPSAVADISLLTYAERPDMPGSSL